MPVGSMFIADISPAMTAVRKLRADFVSAQDRYTYAEQNWKASVLHCQNLDERVVAYLSDANLLAACVRAYVADMDKISERIGDTAIRMTAEREALKLHDRLCQRNSNSSPPKPAAS
jgi:hypothetical protein